MLCIEELKSIDFFENLDDKELELLLSIARKRVFSQGEILFYEKEQPRHLIMVLEGVVKVYKIDQKSNEIVLHRFGSKSLVAEMAVFEGIPYPASAAFESDGSVLEIDFEKFQEYFLANKDIALALFKSLTQKIKYLDNVIALNVVLDSTARVAKYICEDDDAFKMKNNQLAKHLHMTPETLSRILKKFTKLGFVKKENNFYKIVDEEALKIFFE